MRVTENILPHDDEPITQVEAEAVDEAIETHRRMKEPIVQCMDGRIVWLRPEEIAPRPLPGDDEPLPEEIEL